VAEDNLSRQEARDRAALLSVGSYDVRLGLCEGAETFTSRTTVRFTATEAGTSTFIDIDAGSVDKVVLNGRPMAGEAFRSDRSRLLLEGLEEDNELVVVARFAYRHTGVGLHRFVDPVDSRVYLHTQFEPFDAHRVFACFDQPDLKATFALTVEAPDDWEVVSNGAVAERDGGLWRFEPTPPLPTYITAVVAGPYHAVHERHGDIPLGFYCRESLAPHLDVAGLATVTRQGLDFFAAEYGHPYPFGKYDQLFVPEFNFGAMENAGCVTFNESMVFRSRVTDAAYESRASTILHEMAHMWFGDLVTMRWWDDLWLNESFATYMATHGLARATRFTDSWVRFASGVKVGAVIQDQLPSTHPISADIVDTDAVRLHFDGITYSKGASVLKQLVAWVGAEAFTGGVRSYFARHAWGNAELVDLLSALEETSGRDLGAWSKEWLETAGVNTLRVEHEADEHGRFQSLTVLQEAPAEHPTLRSHRVAVGLYRLGDEGLVRTRRIETDVVGARTGVPEVSGLEVPDLVLVNDDDLTYAKVRLDSRSLATVHAHLDRLADPLARNLCWASTWDMVRDAELATRRYVALVAAHAPAEPDDGTLQRLLGQAVLAVDAYGDPANRKRARALLAATARAQLQAAEPGTDRQLVWVRHLASVAGDDDIAFVRGLLDGSVELPGLRVDTDLRWHLLSALAVRGADDDGRLIETELARDPTDIGQRRAAAARASRPTAADKEWAWTTLLDGDLHLAMVRAIASGFGQYGQDELRAPYVDPYFSSLHRLWE
jgi:aminopeptidase N